MVGSWHVAVIVFLCLSTCTIVRAYIYPTTPGNQDAVFAAINAYSLGQRAMEDRRLDDAVHHYERSIAAYTAFGPSYNNLAIVMLQKGFADEAYALHAQAAVFAEQESDWETFASAHNNLGFLVRRGHEKSYERCLLAIEHFDTALRVQSSQDVYISILYNKGSALYYIGQLDESQRVLAEVLALDPNHGSAHLDMGNIYFHQYVIVHPPSRHQHLRRGHLDKALEHQDILVQLGETIHDVTGALNNKGQFLKEIGLVQDALHVHEQALHLRPGDGNTLLNVITARRQLCTWDDADEWHDRLLALTTTEILNHTRPSLLPFDATLMAISDEIKKAVAVAHCPQWEQTLPLDRPPRQTLSSRLRVGYLGYDFRNHPMGQLTIGALEHHNHSRVHVSAFAYGPNDASEWRRRSEAAVDTFRDIHAASDIAAAAQIASDAIDIVVDLMAHTRGARVGIVGLRPAPIVVNYLGYPGTMGASFTDYAIVDRWVVPPTRAAATFTEKLVYLPQTYQVNDYDWAVPTVVDPQPSDHFVFCNFNTINKMEPLSFDTWMRILARVPRSVLWLLEPSQIDARIMQTFRAEAAARGINPVRLVFAPRMPRNQHLARLRDAHLFLDSFIYNAHTTASDMLWTHLPLVTLWGNTFASRVAGSLVSAALRRGGDDDEANRIWTTHSIKEYEDVAVQLATTHQHLLTQFRTRLAANLLEAPLFDAARTTSHLEHAYHCMASLGPHRMHIVVDPRDYGRRYNEQGLIEAQHAKVNQVLDRHHRRGELDRAEIGYRRLLALYPRHADAMHLLGLLYHQQNQPHDALPLMLESVAVAPDVGFFRGNLGEVLRTLNDTANAAEQFHLALVVDPNQPQVFINYMTLLNDAKHFSALVAVFDQYHELLLPLLEPVLQWDFHFQVSFAWSMLGLPEKSIACLESLLRRTPHPTPDIRIRTQYNLAALWGQRGDHERANAISMETVREENRLVFQPMQLPRHLFESPTRAAVVVIYCHEYGQSWWSQWGPHSIHAGVGGSEEAVIYLSRELAMLGYTVRVYGNPPNATVDEFGVEWLPHTAFDVNEPSDVFVAWRYHISTALAHSASLKFVWLHDMVGGASFTPSYVASVDGIFCLSQAHADSLSTAAQAKVIPTGNGLTTTAFVDGLNIPTHFVYGSSPGRGLETVLTAWPTIRHHLPNATLHVYYGFTPAFVQYAQESTAWRERMDQLLLQDGVSYIGLVDHETLAAGYATAGFYLYPTTYPETSCVSIMRAMAAGAIPITSKRGALAQVVGAFDLGPSEGLAGPMTDSWRDEWVASVIKAARQDTRVFRANMKAYAQETFLWSKIARQWRQIFTRNKDLV
ncbi:Aste57867_21112 [Aphanomyces stellatus]|uniref:protein O-GlcNAc transferase n=1 Tax=Aphanomyces stellatus TaxID=120398 RepID=A0A485LHD2_9STRA|nr:hypothetical protein As57867_021044 [Aphanomyces stellatus]VFT97786.1 Aste57867_21112 [Aphanomyces stellatus]